MRRLGDRALHGPERVSKPPERHGNGPLVRSLAVRAPQILSASADINARANVDRIAEQVGLGAQRGAQP